MSKLKVGVVSCRDRFFQTDLNARFSKTMDGLAQMAETLDFDLFIAKSVVYCDEDAQQAVKECEQNEVDFLLIQLTSCPSNGGTWIPIFADIKRARIGIWALPEEAVDGPSPVNSFIGMTFYAGILGNYLTDRDVQFKWFLGNTDDDLFKTRFTVTVHALTALKKMNSSVIGLVGGVSYGFGDLIYDERNVRKVLPGLKIIQHNEYREIKERALRFSDSDVEKAKTEFVRGATSIDAACLRLVDINVRLHMAYKAFAEDNKFDALSLNCIYKLQEDYETEMCAIVAELNDDGIVTSCEGDLMGAISMLLLKYLTGNQPSLMDFPQFDETDNSILLWHCGSSAKCFACDECYSWEKSYTGMPIIRDLSFKPGRVSIARLSGESDSMMIADGNIIPDKKGFLGCRGWIGDVCMYGEKISAIDFVNTVLVNKFHHHYPIAYGNVTDELCEIASWLRLKRIEKVPYKNYFQNKINKILI